MRLIDADALMDDVSKRYCEECEKRRGIKKGRQTIVYEIGDAPCRSCSVDDMKYELETAPTIGERKRGKWRNIQIGGWLGVECTACKIAHDRREVPHGNGGEVAWKFCPECGADMRGGKEDGE